MSTFRSREFQTVVEIIFRDAENGIRRTIKEINKEADLILNEGILAIWTKEEYHINQ